MPKKRLLQYRHAVVFKGSIAGECKHLHIIGQAGHQCGQYAVTLAGIKREVQYLLQDALAVCAVGQLNIIFAAGQCQPVRNAALFEKCRQRTEFFCRICRAASQPVVTEKPYIPRIFGRVDVHIRFAEAVGQLVVQPPQRFAACQFACAVEFLFAR